MSSKNYCCVNCFQTFNAPVVGEETWRDGYAVLLDALCPHCGAKVGRIDRVEGGHFHEGKEDCFITEDEGCEEFSPPYCVEEGLVLALPERIRVGGIKADGEFYIEGWLREEERARIAKFLKDEGKEDCFIMEDEGCVELTCSCCGGELVYPDPTSQENGPIPHCECEMGNCKGEPNCYRETGGRSNFCPYHICTTCQVVQMGFEISAKYPSETVDVEEEMDRWIEFVEEQGWAFGGGGDPDGMEGFLCRFETGSLTDEDRALAEKWLKDNAYKEVVAHPLVDSNADWDGEVVSPLVIRKGIGGKSI